MTLSAKDVSSAKGVGHQDGIDYLVMEHVEGETLSKRLQKGPLPVDQVSLVLNWTAKLNK